MSDSKFEIKIVKEANGSDVELDNLSIQASESLIRIMQALANLAKIDDSGNTKISIQSGSAEAALVGDSYVESLSDTLTVVANNKSDNEKFVRNFRIIQDVIKENGLSYEASFKSNGHLERDVIQLFEQPKTFAKKRKKRIKNHPFHLEFFSGKLIEVGGKTPNIHIESAGESYTIECSEKQAILVNKFLYQKILLSTWVKKDANLKLNYYFCDFYKESDVEMYLEFKDFIRGNTNARGTEALKQIHYKLEKILSSEDYGKARKFIKLFKTDIADVGRLRTILLNTKAFQKHEKFEDILEEVVDLIERKTKQPIF